MRMMLHLCPLLRFKSLFWTSFTALLLVHGAVAQQGSGWKLAWSDEFDGPAGAAPDAAKWKLQAGAGAAVGGNDEAEVYCARDSAAPCRADQPNAYLDGKGHLVIVAVRTDTTVTVGAKKVTSPVYTSARMTSVPTFRYGRIEASIRIPTAGRGIWPAFWALGQESGNLHWPAVGEIDVMEQWNPQPGAPDKIDPLTVHGAVHGPKEPGSAEGYVDLTGDYRFPGAPSNGLHQYAVEWGPGEVDFYVDGYLYERQSVATLTGRELWEQDRGPFTMLLNLAVGGGFFGYPDATTGPTPTMVVDYVRVYQRDGTLPTGWSNADIGGPAEAGYATASNGAWTVAGGGVGIVGRFDQFHFAYQPMAGDGEVTAHVIDQSSKLAQAKAGVMLRQGRGAATLFAMAFVSPDGSVHFRFRGAQGDVPSEVVFKGAATWLKVGRLGDVFTGYASPDGKSWTPIGNTRIAMSKDVDAGLIATARDNKTPNIARFDYVDVTKTDGAWDGLAATVPGFVQAENFDAGGPGFTYSAEFKGGGGKYAYRSGEALPVEAIHEDPEANEPGGYYLAHLPASRYINYAVQVAADGNYALTARVASAGKGGAFHFNIDQVAISKPMPVPDTGGDGKWQTISAGAVHLTAGRHVLALVTDSGGQGSDKSVGNFDFFTIRAH